MAQPAGFVHNTACTDPFINQPGVALGKVTVNGADPIAGSWIAAFDVNFNIAGADPIQIKFNDPPLPNGSYMNTSIYQDGDIPAVPCASIDAGISGCPGACENFFLVLYNSSDQLYYIYPSFANPTQLPYSYIPGFPATIGGFADPLTPVNFIGPGLPSVAALPVELLFFRGAPKASDVLLEWATASEQNNDFFEVQRSVDGREFEVLGKVAGAGTHTGLLAYEFTDRSPRPGVNYYRLRQVDFDGAFEYSSVVSIKATGKEGGMALYPNPAGEYVEVSLPAAWSEGETELLLRDVSGRVLRKLQYSNVDGPLRVSTEGLPGGYYTLQASNGREFISERVVVMRP